MKRRLSLVDMRNTSDDPWTDVDTRKAKRIKNKSKDKTATSASQPSELIDNVIDAVAGDSTESADVHKSSSSTQTESFVFSGDDVSLLQSMQCEMRQLKETITTLSSKIDQLSKVILSDSQFKTASTIPTYASVSSATVHSAPPATTGQSKSVQGVRTTNSSHDLQHHDAVTAMYIDLNIRKQRANNIVITGMLPAESPDHEIKAVIDLLTTEFGWDTDLCPGVSVARCRRLGKPQDGKLQPLLVTLDTRDQAEFYIKNACLLRQSDQPEIRKNVFINPDLTPSEGKAAFELRQRRRMRIQDTMAATHDTSAIQGRTFYPSSIANKSRDKSVGPPTVTTHHDSVSLMAASATNLSSPAVESQNHLKSPPPRLVYRSEVTAKAPIDGHLVEQHQQPILPAPSSCVQHVAATNNQIVVAAETHALF